MAQGEEDKTGRSAQSAAASRLLARRTAKAAAKASKRGTAPIVPSGVTQRVLSAKSWYDDQHRLLWGVAAGTVALVGVMFAVDAYLDKSRREAGELLRVAVTTANAPIVTAEADPPEDETPDESYPNRAARAAKAQERFHLAVVAHLNAVPTAWAKLGEANALSELGKPEGAAAEYEQVASAGDLPAFVRWRALEGAGYALEAQQKYADAAKHYEEIGKLPGGEYKVAGDYQLARMDIALGAPQKAADVLQALVKAERARPPGEGARFQTVVTDAETLLTELSVQLNAPNLRADIPAPAAQTPPRGPAASSGGQNQISEEIVEQLRKQLASGKGQKGLTKEVVDALAKQAKSGQSGAPTSSPSATPKSSGAQSPVPAPKGKGTAQ